MTTRAPVPVLCDRCRAEGLAGEGDFAGLGDLLDFEPVPLQVNRVDGWTAETQRAFIAALSVLGSSDRAARAVGKSATGAERLRRLPGADSFILAWERAKAIAREKGTLRLANSLRTATADRTPPPEPPPPDGPDREADKDRATLEAFEKLFEYYLRRLELERIARLEGKVVEADFFVRQITVFEICMDLLVGDTEVLKRIRQLSVDGHSVLHVAETTMSRLLDDARRDKWAELAEPGRPPPLADDQMIERHGYRLLRHEVFHVGVDGDYAEWCAARKEEYAAAARAQVEWEERSRREAEEWRARHGAGAAADGDPPAGDGGSAEAAPDGHEAPDAAAGGAGPAEPPAPGGAPPAGPDGSAAGPSPA
ncbi:MAG TPA: hypothetical protein VEA61_13875 [Allosphingosinicella sp.]|nr:hypothetical protein [Allosphingosinicella sp.]